MYKPALAALNLLESEHARDGHDIHLQKLFVRVKVNAVPRGCGRVRDNELARARDEDVHARPVLESQQYLDYRVSEALDVASRTSDGSNPCRVPAFEGREGHDGKDARCVRRRPAAIGEVDEDIHVPQVLLVDQAFAGCEDAVDSLRRVRLRTGTFAPSDVVYPAPSDGRPLAIRRHAVQLTLPNYRERKFRGMTQCSCASRLRRLFCSSRSLALRRVRQLDTAAR